jgi:hypothetical protein
MNGAYRVEVRTGERFRPLLLPRSLVADIDRERVELDHGARKRKVKK